MRIRTFILAALLSGSPLNAQRGDLPVDEEDRIGEPEGFFFTPSRISGGRDAGFLAGQIELEDRILDVMPAGVGFLNLTPRSEFFFAYEPEFEFFEKHDSLNSWNHAVGFRFDYDATRRWRFSTGGSFISTQDLTRRLGSLIVLPRGDARQSAAFLRFSYQLSRRTTLDLGFENSTSKTPFPGQALPFLDQMVNAGRVTLTRSFGRDHSVGVIYSYAKPDLLEDVGFRSAILTNPLHTAELAYSYGPPDFLLRFSGGVTYSDYELRDDLSYAFSGGFQKRIARMEISAGYSRRQAYLGSLLLTEGRIPVAAAPGLNQLPTALTQTADFTVRGRLARHFGMEATIVGSEIELEDPTRSRLDITALFDPVRGFRLDIRSVRGRVRLDYQLASRVVVFASAEMWDQNLNQLLGVPISRQRYMGGIQILLSGPTEPEYMAPRAARLRSVLQNHSLSPLWVDTRTHIGR